MPKQKPPPVFRVIYKQAKELERTNKELQRKAKLLSWAAQYPDLQDSFMAIYDKPARKTTRKERETELATLSPEVVLLSRRLSESVKKRPKLKRREET